MEMVWEAYGLPGSQSFVEQIQVNSLEDSAFRVSAQQNLHVVGLMIFRVLGRSCDKLRWSWWFLLMFLGVFFVGGKVFAESTKNHLSWRWLNFPNDLPRKNWTHHSVDHFYLWGAFLSQEILMRCSQTSISKLYELRIMDFLFGQFIYLLIY